MEKEIENIIEELGYDTNDPNLKETPCRVRKMYEEYRMPTHDELMDYFDKSFPTNYKGMVVQKDIVTKSLCPHHLMPIEYKIAIGIIYKSNALGLSKFTRLVKRLSRQLILQEELTHKIKYYLTEGLLPQGVAVVVSGIHGCMKFRGIEQSIPTITTELTGPFYEDPKCREEFFLHLRNNNH